MFKPKTRIGGSIIITYSRMSLAIPFTSSWTIFYNVLLTVIQQDIIIMQIQIYEINTLELADQNRYNEVEEFS